MKKATSNIKKEKKFRKEPKFIFPDQKQFFPAEIKDLWMEKVDGDDLYCAHICYEVHVGSKENQSIRCKEAYFVGNTKQQAEFFDLCNKTGMMISPFDEWGLNFDPGRMFEVSLRFNQVYCVNKIRRTRIK